MTETTTLWDKKKERTRQAIVKAAMRLFAKRGFDRVTVEDIARAADVAPRTFFRYFPAKEEVLFDESAEHCRRFLDVLDTQPMTASPFEAVHGAMHAIVPTYEPDREAFRLRMRIIAETPALAGREAQLIQPWETMVGDHMTLTQRVASLNELELQVLVAVTTSAFRVALFRWIADDKADLRTLTEAAFEPLQHGYR
jgi:AcrR family transcriptional regulator